MFLTKKGVHLQSDMNRLVVFTQFRSYGNYFYGSGEFITNDEGYTFFIRCMMLEGKQTKVGLLNETKQGSTKSLKYGSGSNHFISY